MQTQTDGGLCVVGDFCAPVEVNRCVGFACCDDLNSPGGEQGTEADVEREVGGFFELATVEMGADIVTAVGRIEDYYEAGSGSRNGGRSCGWWRWKGLLREARKR